MLYPNVEIRDPIGFTLERRGGRGPEAATAGEARAHTSKMTIAGMGLAKEVGSVR